MEKTPLMLSKEKYVGMLLSARVLKSFNSIENISPRMMCISFNSIFYTTIVPCNSSTNARDETDFTNFYNEQSSPVQHIPKTQHSTY